jgi:hypothetical protein
MEIVAAVYIEQMDVRQVPGPSTRIDLTGVHFSAPAATAPPLTVTPHLMVVIWCPAGAKDTGALEVTFERDGEQIARNVQPLAVEPGKFSYRLVRPELEFADLGTVLARCRVDLGPVTTAPYTLLAPVSDASQ